MALNDVALTSRALIRVGASDACKVPTAHIDLLIKLARWADLPDPAVENEGQQQLLQALIQKGREELGRE